MKVSLKLTLSSPFFLVNYAILVYVLVFTAYYFHVYSVVENVYVTSAVIERSTLTQLSLVLYFDSVSSPRDVFLLLDEKGQRLKLEKSELTDNPKIQTWSGEIDPSFIQEELRITAEHDKTPLLADHYGRPALQLSTTESYTEHHDVVTCMSPISDTTSPHHAFSAITSAIAAGSFVDVPFTTALTTPLYDTWHTWQRRQLIRLHVYPITRHELVDDETRRALAFAHCHLLYRRAAKFVVFQNGDEIVVPIRETSYVAEFSALFLPNNAENQLARYNAQVLVGGEHGNLRVLITDDVGRDSPMVLKNSSPFEEITKIGQLYTTKLNGTEYGVRINVDQFDTYHRKSLCHVAGGKWKCASSTRCIRPNMRHESVQGLYNYDIHQSTFLQFASFDC